ncbi:AimR family lysis-lysogeny pheromone receptor [Caldalkalibacillus salinus]|uniref:AimR family lysis-lysogeny pheromone receptor n=1 Tax=Caldalkalibacillus salinus TaxID=2803787 RepID=UPI001920AEF9|nr:AimR family lysis-lysogeny pheromone receptor [Caldalkalibacillus salinus]
MRHDRGLASKMLQYEHGNLKLKWEILSYLGRIEELDHSLRGDDGLDNLAEWRSAYHLLALRSQKKIEPQDLIQKIQYQTSDDPNLFVLYRLIQGYAYYDSHEFGLISSVLREIKESIPLMDDRKLQEMYQLRLVQLQTNYHLRTFYIQEAQEGCQYIIDNSNNPTYIASAYHTLGISYLYDDYTSGMRNLKRSLRMYQLFGQRSHNIGIRRTIIFFNHYWSQSNQYMLFSNQQDDMLEHVHGEVRLGNISKAKNILERIDVPALSATSKGFYYYFKGLTYNSIDDFYQSIISFKNMDDKFYANLGRLELYKLNERSSAIEAAFY